MSLMPVVSMRHRNTSLIEEVATARPYHQTVGACRQSRDLAAGASRPCDDADGWSVGPADQHRSLLPGAVWRDPARAAPPLVAPVELGGARRSLGGWRRAGRDGRSPLVCGARAVDVLGPRPPQVCQTHREIWFEAEVIHGDYIGFVRASTADACTQYELWKAIWSAINDRKLHELARALGRHHDMLATFVPATFVGNHD